MSTLPSRPLPPTLLSSLNALLVALALPFTVDHPTDLTPSLLLAIFESLINARLPIPTSVRQSRTREAKSRAMLVLLGVLECDVLRGGTASADTDADYSVVASNADDSVLGGAGGVSVDGWVDEIGLGEVDPEQLADGGWDETIFVGELLCWLARRRGILPRAKSSHRHPHRRSLYSNHSYGTEGDTVDFSTSLLLRPSPAQKSRSPRPLSPSVDDFDAEADLSALSHITDVPRHPLVHSPEPSLSASAMTDLSIRARSVSSQTSVSNAHNDPDEFEVSQDTLRMYDPRQMMQDAQDDDDHPPSFRPHCIHELEDPSYIRALAGPSSSFDSFVSRDRVSGDEFRNGDDLPRDDDHGVDEQDNDDPYAPPTPTPRRIRLTGWIDTVDTVTELSQFAASRSHSHPRSYASASTSAVSASGPSSRSQPQLHTYAYTNEHASRPKTEMSHPPRPGSAKSRQHVSSPPSPSPSLPLPTSLSRQPSSRLPSSTPPSPPSPPTHSDPPFDVSFSGLNNTSTPAKPRPHARPQSHAKHTMPRDDPHVGMDKSKSGGSTIATLARPRHRDRSPSYTPPSYSTPGNLAGTQSVTRLASTSAVTFGAKTRLDVPASGGTPTPSSSTTRRKLGVSHPLVDPPPGTRVPPGSTATTNSLLTERARLLTELAALKRVRAASGAGTGRDGTVSRVGVGVEFG